MTVSTHGRCLWKLLRELPEINGRKCIKRYLAKRYPSWGTASSSIQGIVKVGGSWLPLTRGDLKASMCLKKDPYRKSFQLLLWFVLLLKVRKERKEEICPKRQGKSTKAFIFCKIFGLVSLCNFVGYHKWWVKHGVFSLYFLIKVFPGRKRAFIHPKKDVIFKNKPTNVITELRKCLSWFAHGSTT